ncbi:MAG: hypothetical protein QXE90_01865 [Candidatus Micrarchaeia archaeon]
MVNYHDNFNESDKDYSELHKLETNLEKKKKRIKSSLSGPSIMEETIMRITKSPVYKSDSELIPIIKLAVQFEESDTALNMLHNCHVMRINNQHPSSIRKLTASIQKIMNGSKSIKLLEKVTELLSGQDSYEIKEEEMEKIKIEIEKRISATNARIKKMKEKKKRNEDENEYEDSAPSEEDLKKIEREFRKIINSKDEDITASDIE